MSHKLALEDFVVNSTFDWALILEDDVYPRLGFKLGDLVGLKSIIDVGIVHLGGQDGLSPLFSPLTMAKKISGGALILNPLFHRFLYRTCCYFIHKDSARKIISSHNQYNLVADDWSFLIRRSGVDRLYFYNLIAHPVDLFDSLIHVGRHGKC